MSSSTLQAEVCIDDVQKDTDISGYVHIVTSEDILMDEITAKIYFEARGRMRGFTKDIATIAVINAPIIIKAGEENILPFSCPLDEYVESYEGQNVSFTYNCEVKMHVDEDDFKKLGLNFMASVKSFLTSDKRLRARTQFEVIDRQHTYRVKEGTYDFGLKLNYVLPIAVGIIMSMLFIAFTQDNTIWYVVLGIIVIAAVTYGIHFYLEDTLGKLTMTLENVDETHFCCRVEKTRKFKLKEQFVYYEIIEEVEDRRGTKTTTYRECQYASLRKEMKNFSKNAEFTFEYPTRLDYATLKADTVEIYWRMCLTGVSSLGLPLKYTATFKVKKDRPIPVEEGQKALKSNENDTKLLNK
ncbi:MAG: hypothetical protein AAF617_07025 [Bacteroidota bacterium]